MMMMMMMMMMTTTTTTTMMMMMMMMWLASVVSVGTERCVQNPAGQIAYMRPIKLGT
jgi:hypothetical protein